MMGISFKVVVVAPTSIFMASVLDFATAAAETGGEQTMLTLSDLTLFSERRKRVHGTFQTGCVPF